MISTPRHTTSGHPALALALLVSACGGSEPDPVLAAEPPAVPSAAPVPTPGPEEAGEAGLSDEELELLEAMGYADVAEEVADPALTGVRVLDPDAVAPGLRLYTASGDCAAHLMTVDGTVVHSWSRPVPGHSWMQADLLRSGHLLVPVHVKDDERRTEGHLLRFSWDGELRWQVNVPVHHDVEREFSGQLLSLTHRVREHPDGESGWLLDNGLVRLSNLGAELDELSLLELLWEAPDFEVKQAKPESWMRLDPIHANSVEVMVQEHLFGEHPLYAPGHVLVSMRHQDAVIIVDFEERRLVWSWGQGEIGGPHDARLLRNGNVLIFDNGQGRGWSRVVEVDPRTDEIVWQYGDREEDRFYTGQRGSSQRLPNGNTLIADSNAGEAFEVTPDGRKVWTFGNPVLDEEGRRTVIVRMVHYPERWFDELPFAIEAGAQR